jgi:hypothetical protein
MDLVEIEWGCRVDSTGSEKGPVAVFCECGDKPTGFGATDLVKH